jgi:ectoine hydroxylase-related dioxygenase (phytanoyl-CoA dioxygenase family)
MAQQDSRELLSAEERRAIAAAGWLRLRGLLSPREREAMHTAWDRLAPVGNTETPELHNEPAYAVCATHPRALAAVAVLLGSDFVVETMRGRSPTRGHGGQGLHVDWREPVPPDRQLLVNIFWLLDDMDAQNGATRIVPGSHLWARTPHGQVAQPDKHHREQIAACGAAGDAIVFSSHLWHSGSRNLSGRRRRVAIAQLRRAG